MLDDQAAARAERKTVDAHGLIGSARGPIGHAAGPRTRIADRTRADDARRGDVLIEERRRHRQHARHVVESVGLIVLGQERCRIDLEPEQILDGGGVLRAVQSMQRDATWIRVGAAASSSERSSHDTNESTLA